MAVAVTEISELLATRPALLFREDPAVPGLMEYMRAAADWLEDPADSGLMEWRV